MNSRRGVRFRQWATATLRDHLVRGYTLNRQRLEQNARELESTLALVRKAASGEALTGDQGRGLVDIIGAVRSRVRSLIRDGTLPSVATGVRPRN